MFGGSFYELKKKIKNAMSGLNGALVGAFIGVLLGALGGFFAGQIVGTIIGGVLGALIFGLIGFLVLTTKFQLSAVIIKVIDANNIAFKGVFPMRKASNAQGDDIYILTNGYELLPPAAGTEDANGNLVGVQVG
jgi:outer membrane lipoprotein SlyB